MFQIIQQSSKDSNEAYTYLLEYIVGNFNPKYIPQFDSKLEWYLSNPAVTEPLNKVYSQNLSKLKEDFYDHLGELYIENVVSKADVKKHGLHLTPPQIVEFMTKATIHELPKPDDKPLYILDPAVGSGRFLLEAYRTVPNSRLFGVDINLDLVRTCITNLELRGIKNYCILHANTLLHELALDKEEGIYNWKFSNRWQSHMKELKTM